MISLIKEETIQSIDIQVILIRIVTFFFQVANGFRYRAHTSSAWNSCDYHTSPVRIKYGGCVATRFTQHFAGNFSPPAKIPAPHARAYAHTTAKTIPSPYTIRPNNQQTVRDYTLYHNNNCRQNYNGPRAESPALDASRGQK